MDIYQQQISTALQDSFEKDLLAAAVAYLDREDDLLRFSSFCYSIRELLRHVLSRLSPDEQVKACALWYEPETSSGIPSSRQRLFYAIWGGMSQHLLREVLNIDIRKSWNDIRVSFKTISSTAHITPETINISHEECKRQGQELLKSLSTIFSQISACREDIANSLQQYIDGKLLDTFISISFSELNLNNSRVVVHSSRLTSFKVVNIDSHAIYIEGNGTVIATLSNGNEEGVEETYPFSFHCTSNVMDPKQLSISADNIEIDIDAKA